MNLKKALAILVALLVISPLAYCGLFGEDEYSGPEIRGTVTDVDTGKPIAGAVVIWTWEGMRSMGIADAQHECYRIDFATTDENGRFLFPAWKFRTKKFPYLRNRYHGPEGIYKSGYKWFVPENGTSGIELQMKSTTELNDTEKAKLLARIYSNTSCTYANETMTDATKAQYIQLIRQLRKDVMKLAESNAKGFLLENSAKELKNLEGVKK